MRTRRTAWTLGALGALAVLLPLPAAPALACSCAGEQEDRAALARADVVVSGEVLERREPLSLPLVPSGDTATYVVRVARVHKGEAARVIEVATARSGASCGLELPASGPALLFLQEEAGALRGGLCDGSRTASDEQAVAALGTGRPPAEDAGGLPGAADDDVPAGAVAAVTALVLVVVVLLRRRRRPGAAPG